MIYEHFRSTGAYEAAQGLSDLFNTRVQNDDVQDFHVRWDQAPLSANVRLADTVLEGFLKSKLQDSVQLQTVFSLYDQETGRHDEQPSYSRLKTSVSVVYLCLSSSSDSHPIVSQFFGHRHAVRKTEQVLSLSCIIGSFGVLDCLLIPIGLLVGAVSRYCHSWYRLFGPSATLANPCSVCVCGR